MENYKQLLRHVLSHGERRSDRTGVGTFSTFFETIHFLPEYGFPLLPLRFISFKTIFYELMFFLRGETNVKYLTDHGVKIWNNWADKDGNLGPIYGKQWRDWNGVDQIGRLMQGLKDDPLSRRLVVSAWNASELNDMALPPCHYSFQCYVSINDQKRHRLSMLVNMRSSDLIVGLPHNIAEYALLMHLMCATLDYDVGELNFTLGDAHIYTNHVEAAWDLIKRTSLDLPLIEIVNVRERLEDYTIDDIKLINYKHHDRIKLDVAI